MIISWSQCAHVSSNCISLRRLRRSSDWYSLCADGHSHVTASIPEICMSLSVLPLCACPKFIAVYVSTCFQLIFCVITAYLCVRTSIKKWYVHIIAVFVCAEQVPAETPCDASRWCRGKSIRRHSRPRTNGHETSVHQCGGTCDPLE